MDDTVPDKTTWGDFEVDLRALLGRGGMGAVYRGRQISLDRPVAVKVLDTSRAPTEEFEQGFLEKFEAEAKALARVRDPRIITVFQAGRNDGRWWYAMELIEGETVEARLSRDGMFEVRDAARIALDVARALDAANRVGIIHRDVKPANIFLLREGGSKLGDFGIARAVDAPPSRLTEANAVVATPTYCSPEQGLCGTCDHRSDIYSLGVVLYEMLTERPPFAGTSPMETLYKHTNEAPPPPRVLAPAISPAMEAVVLHCLQKDPADRYQTYADLIDDLEAVANGRPLRHAREAMAIAIVHEVPSRGWWAAGVLGAALLAVVLAQVHRSVPPRGAPSGAASAAGSGPRVAEAERQSQLLQRVLALAAEGRPADALALALDDRLDRVPDGLPAAALAQAQAADRKLDADAIRAYVRLVSHRREHLAARGLPPEETEVQRLAAHADAADAYHAAMRKEGSGRLQALDDVLAHPPDAPAWKVAARRIYEERVPGGVRFDPAPTASWAALCINQHKQRREPVWESDDGAFFVSDPNSREVGTLLVRPVEGARRGWTVTFRFVPAEGAAEPSVAVTTTTYADNRLARLLMYEPAARRASLVEVSGRVLGEIETSPLDVHEAALVHLNRHVLVYFDGELVHADAPEDAAARPADVLTLGASQGEVRFTEIRIHK